MDAHTIEEAKRYGWGVERERVVPGARLLQGPHGERSYVVVSLDDKGFHLKNLETGTLAHEAWAWLPMYKEILSNGAAAS
jgi:hypothetical protein